MNRGRGINTPLSGCNESKGNDVSMRTVIEINHAYLNKLRDGESFMWHRLLMGLSSCDIDQGEKEFLASRGLRILGQRHHSETLELKVE